MALQGQAFLYPVGVSDYRELVSDHFLYVDKSLAILDVISDAKVSIICRPRRFGKTLFISMLQHFFAENVHGAATAPLFENTLLAQQSPETLAAHQGAYSVIAISFKDIKLHESYALAYEALQGLISTLYREHDALLQSAALKPIERDIYERICNKTASEDELRTSLKFLSSVLSEAYAKPVIVLIDEYDTPIIGAYTQDLAKKDENFYNHMIQFMRGFLGAGLKDNPYVFKTVITGITRIAKENLFSDLNNAEVYTVLADRHSDAFGFTEAEVNVLLQKTNLTSHAKDIKNWYNGYHIGNSTIYNPWSIITCLKHQGTLKLYWVNTSGNELIKHLLSEANPTFKVHLEALLQGEVRERVVDEHVTFESLNTNESALWSLLLFSGYITADGATLNKFGRYQCPLRIPNYELMQLFHNEVLSWFQRFFGEDDYNRFVEFLLKGELDAFQRELSRFLTNSMSYYDATGKEPERFYHGLVLGLIATLEHRYRIYSNREGGYGRYDIALVPADKTRLGLVIEFKSIENPEDLKQGAVLALQQVQTKRYETELQANGIRKILQIGMAFCGKQVAITHSILDS